MQHTQAIYFVVVFFSLGLWYMQSLISLNLKKSFHFFLSLRAGGILQILQSGWFRERAVFHDLARWPGRNRWQLHSGSTRGGGGGVVVYQYTRKKFAKIPENTQNSSKYTQNYTQVYFIPEIQRKWYTEYPYLSCNIPYTRFKKPLYNPGRPCSFTSLICLLFVKEQNPWFVNHFSFKTCAVISIS